MASKLLTTDHLPLFDSAYTRRYAPNIDGPIRVWRGTSTDNEYLLFEGADVTIGRGQGIQCQWLWFKNGIPSSGNPRGFTVAIIVVPFIAYLMLGFGDSKYVGFDNKEA